MKFKNIIYLQIIFLLEFIPSKSFASLKNIELNNFLTDINQGIEKRASLAFMAVDIENDKELFSINKHKSLIPASLLKLFTTTSAIEILGENYIFETKIAYDGVIDKSGTLHGNIIIIGGADPCLGSKMFYDQYYKSFFLEDWVNAIKKKGIYKIEGCILADSSLYDSEMVPNTWCWEDIGNYYGAGYSGLSIFDNTFEVKINNSSNFGKSTKIVSINPDLPLEIQIINKVKKSTKPKTKINIFRGSYQNKIFIRGYMSKNDKYKIVKGAIPHSALWAAFILHKKLIEHSIEVTKGYDILDNYNKKQFLYSHILIKTKSPKLKKIINSINKKSINLYTEHLLAHLGYKLKGRGNTKLGAKALIEFWKNKGLDTKGIHICDGCGISRYNAFSPYHMIFLLKYIYRHKLKNTLLSSFSVCGKDGTLEEKFCNRKLINNLIAKTGSMTRVFNLAGILNTKKNTKIAFTLMINNHICKQQKLEKAIENFLVALYDNY